MQKGSDLILSVVPSRSGAPSLHYKGPGFNLFTLVDQGLGEKVCYVLFYHIRFRSGIKGDFSEEADLILKKAVYQFIW